MLKCSNESVTTNSSSSTITCIPRRLYNVSVAYVSATQKLLTMLPEVENLTDCSFVNESFNVISREQCAPLMRSINIVWITLVVLSSVTTFTMLLWLSRFCGNRGKEDTFSDSGSSILLRDEN